MGQGRGERGTGGGGNMELFPGAAVVPGRPGLQEKVEMHLLSGLLGAGN